MPKKPSKEDAVETIVSLSPKHKSFTVMKLGVGDWRVITYEVQDDKIIGRVASEGGNRALALERFKLLAAKEFFIGK